MSGNAGGLDMKAMKTALEWLNLQESYVPFHGMPSVTLSIDTQGAARLAAIKAQLRKNMQVLRYAISKSGDREIRRVYQSLMDHTQRQWSTLEEAQDELKRAITARAETKFWIELDQARGDKNV